MKAFISHSSKDKGFVEKMVGQLRPGTYELDSQTFDLGLVNAEAILKSMKRCDLFCLILSKESANSNYVNFETLLSHEMFARGTIDRFLVLCIDDKAFNLASENVKFFNVARKNLAPESAARIVQGQLLSAAKTKSNLSHPFIGREDEIDLLGRQINDHRRPPSKAIYISGNVGSGRRSIAEHFLRQYFPQVGNVLPTIDAEQFSGLEELHRKVLMKLRPTITARELLVRAQSFTVATDIEKSRMIADLFNSLLSAREAAFVVDYGGILTDSGGLTAEIDSLFSHLNDRPHPCIIFISARMIPRRHRRTQDDISYIAVRSLTRPATGGVISRLSKDRAIELTDENLEELITLSDSHPYNIYRMIDEVEDRGLDLFLANPSDFINWKHRRSSEYLMSVRLSEIDISILAILKILPELDFLAIVESLELDGEEASEAITKLLNLHVVESANQCFIVAPALRVAVERDSRIRLPQNIERSAIGTLANSLALRLEEGTAPVSLVDSTVLASLQSGDAIPDIAGGFLLPSHYIWMARRSYDERRWIDCIRYAKDALKGRAQISKSGFVGACRFLCLAAARIGDDETFQYGLTMLREIAKDDWAKSNLAFLEGFNSRLKGHLPEAEKSFRQAYNLSPGNFSAARELASVYLDLGNFDEAEIFARETYRQAPSNPFQVDILVAVLVKKYQGRFENRAELDDLFRVLEQVGEEGGRSFFTTRRAEFEHLWGDNREALRLIEKAVRRTPNLFEPRRLHAEILLKSGNKTKAYETISVMKEMVDSNDPEDRRKNYRQYLKTLAQYLVEVGQYKDAKKLFRKGPIFTEEERNKEIKNIEITQAYRTT